MSAEVIDGLDFVKYLDRPETSGSRLKEILPELGGSPLLYKHRTETPREDNDTLRQGRAVHTAVLEPERFIRDYALWPKENGKRASKKWDEFVGANVGKTILTEDQYDTAIRTAKAIRQHPVAKQLLSEDGKPELSVVWTHARTGIRIKCRFDWLSSALLDIKSARDVSHDAFAKACVRYGYAFSMALYSDALAASGLADAGHPVKLVAAQKEEPNDVAVYHLGAEVLDYGRRQYERALDLLVYCQAAKQWPGVQTGGEDELRLPSWADASGNGVSTETTDGESEEDLLWEKV